MLKKISAGSFAMAWQMLTEFPLPESLKKSGKNFDSDAYGHFVQISFPIVGLALGICAWVIGGALSAMFSTIAAAVLFSMLMTFLSEYKDHLRGSRTLMSLVEQQIAKRPFNQSLLLLDNDVNKITNPLSGAVMLSALILKLVFFFIMSYCGFYYWMIAVLTLEFALQGYMAGAPLFNTGAPLLNIPREANRHIWFAAGFICLFILFRAPYPTLLAFGAAFIAAHGIRNYCEKYFDGVSIDIISLSGYVFELLALLLGVVFLTGK
jgi:cobalamin synthase